MTKPNQHKETPEQTQPSTSPGSPPRIHHRGGDWARRSDQASHVVSGHSAMRRLRTARRCAQPLDGVQPVTGRATNGAPD